MEQNLKAYAAAVQTAFEHQQVLLAQYSNAAGVISTRKILPCSPFVVSTDGATVIFNAYSETVRTTGQNRGPGVFTFRLDRILNLDLYDFEIKDIQGFWKDVLGVTNGATIVFPGKDTPLYRGKYPLPTVANGGLEKFLAKGWTTKPKAGFIQKTAATQRQGYRLRFQ